jgi:CPA1 family monovalent cation:H+ antiporter
MLKEEVGTVLMLITAMASYINHRYLQLPKSIGLTFVTFFVSILIVVLQKFDVSFAVNLIEMISTLEFSHTFLQRMLGFLLFAGALQIDPRDLYKHKVIIALLSTVSVLISTFLIGMGTWVIIQCVGMHMPILYCFLFGALISPTDPVAVMSILKSTKAPKSLEMKIAGEALFNDAMGIVLFVAISGLANGTLQLSLFDFCLFFLRQAAGGIIFGLLLGEIFSRLIKDIDSAFVLILMTISLVSTGYLVAEHYLNVSPVITIGISGLSIGNRLRRDGFSLDIRRHLYDFWEFVDEILNAFLFVLIGLEFLEITSSPVIFVACMGTIGITVIARWISVAVPLGWIAGFRSVNSQLVWLMTWGGMRGGISIALALMIPSTVMYRNMIVAVTYSVVIFSIIVQGMTIAPLMNKMNLSKAKFKPKVDAIEPSLHHEGVVLSHEPISD